MSFFVKMVEPSKEERQAIRQNCVLMHEEAQGCALKSTIFEHIRHEEAKRKGWILGEKWICVTYMAEKDEKPKTESEMNSTIFGESYKNS